MGNVHHKQGRYGEALSHYSAALEIAREIGDRQLEGHLLTYLGRVHRMSGRLEDTRSHQADALALLREIGIKDALGECLCESGHLKLHDGELADEELEEVRAIAKELAMGPTTDLGKAVERLERAVVAHGRGEKLYYGQCLGDYPAIIQTQLKQQHS